MRYREFVTEINLVPDFEDDNSEAIIRNEFGSKGDTFKLADFGDLMTIYADNGAMQNGGNFYMVDSWGEPVGWASVLPWQTPGMKNVFYISNVQLRPKYRGQGVGYAFYVALLNAGMTLRSDTDQTEASRGLWSKLARNFDVYIVDNDGNAHKTDDTEDAYGRHGHALIARSRSPK